MYMRNNDQIQGDQIASLYDLLTFEDKPVARSVMPEKGCSKHHAAPTLSYLVTSSTKFGIGP